MRKIQNLIPRWDALRIAGKSKVVSLTVFVPFLGYFILFNAHVIEYLDLSKSIFPSSINTSPSQETISRVFYLYFGLSFIGIASLYFTWFFPKEIKENLNEYDFISKQEGVATQQSLISLVRPFQKEPSESDILIALKKCTHLSKLF